MSTKRSFHAKIAKRIIRRIERHGYFVTLFHVNEAVEMHAVSIDRSALHIARCNDGVVPNQECRLALVMAEALGINL